MAQNALRTHYTHEEYAGFPEDGKRYEILGGDLFVNPAPLVNHQRIVVRLLLLLEEWSRRGAGGCVLVSPVDVHLSPDTIVQPDLIWVSPARSSTIVKQVIRGAPDLVIEVLSPRTARNDRTLKRDYYARHGVREYWLVDPAEESVSILGLEGDGFAAAGAGTGEEPLSSLLDSSLQVVSARLFAGLDRD